MAASPSTKGVFTNSATQKRLLSFLQEELALPSDSISLALRHLEQDPGPLPIVLWQYGLITIDQLSQIYDWLENA